jgi:hemerythrin
MALIDWSNDLSVNIKEIDAQHKKLIELINTLHEAMRIGQGKTALEKILADLITYTKTHFAYEEMLMTKHGFAAMAEHKKEHDQLTSKVADLQAQYQSGAIVMSVEVLQFLKQWLGVHIKGTDKKYSAYFNGKGIS